MPVAYEVPPAPRFVVEPTADGEQIRIPARRQLFITLFIALWTCAWTVGGITVFRSQLATGFHALPALWLCGWAVGEGLVLVTLAWMYGGCEIVHIAGGDLEIRAELFGLVRRRRYRADEIRDIGPAAIPLFGRSKSWALPILTPNRFGAVKFSYGARTVYIAPDLDETEGRLIADRIRKGLRLQGR